MEVSTKDGLVGSVELIDHMGDELKLVNTAKMCRGKSSETFGEGEERLMRVLIQMNHGAVFEQAALTFDVTCPVFVRTQLFRHRLASPMEVSRRSTHGDVELWTPNAFRELKTKEKNEAAVELMNKAYKEAKRAYRNMLSMGVLPEQARTVLPQGMMTTFRWTMNLREFIHVVRERTSDSAQKETVAIVSAMAELASPLFPTFSRQLGWMKNAEGK